MEYLHSISQHIREHLRAHKAVGISIIPSDIVSILFINCICKLYACTLYKEKLDRHKKDTFQHLIEILRNRLLLCLLIPMPGFPHVYYILDANLGSLLHGDNSVMLEAK